MKRIFVIVTAALLMACGHSSPPDSMNARASLPNSGEAGRKDLPLLGGPRGGNVWGNFCAGQPDSAALPRDPRTLVQPGVNSGKAVAFNAYWRTCDNGVPRPTTCGELRAQSALGGIVGLGNGEIGSPTSFAGGSASPSGLPADQYNSLWQVWGLSSRPDNFDTLVAERYGSPASLVRNPYPLPGEDPNATNGGSGQLPMVFTQIREADGTWRGEIGTKVCVFCHAGQLGTAADGPGLGPQLGGAGAIGDFTVACYDFAKAGDYAAGATAGITISTNRGTGAIDFFQLGFVLFSRGDPHAVGQRQDRTEPGHRHHQEPAVVEHGVSAAEIPRRDSANGLVAHRHGGLLRLVQGIIRRRSDRLGGPARRTVPGVDGNPAVAAISWCDRHRAGRSGRDSVPRQGPVGDRI